MNPAPSRTVVAPRPPESPPPHRLPLVPVLAPLAMSLVLFAATRSPFTLVFAALGPLVVVASTADAALQRRRGRRREALRFAVDVARVAEEIAAVHRDEASTANPTLGELLSRPALVVARWRSEDALPLRLGAGVLPSTLRYESASAEFARPEPSVGAALAELKQSAQRLENAPIAVDLPTQITISGPDRLRGSLLRSVVLQLAAALSPRDWTIAAPIGAEEWFGALPHSVVENAAADEVRFRSSSRPELVVRASATGHPPLEPAVEVELSADGTARRGDTVFRPDLLSREEATSAAATLAHVARRANIGPMDDDALPAEVLFGSVGGDHGSPISLSATVGAEARGPLILDLVADGPHAIVGGTTGSGKSELLLSWVLGIAAARAPSVVSFLFVDFKGGASFGSLLDLPHSVGVITDLDTEQAHRALASLSAELRHRERDLAASGLRGIDETETAPFARLVVVVDEYAALVETFPVLHAVFADIAARGRSLGVHLVLCTQRPAGVIRDGILANCALRISLRVTSPADSAAVLGTDDAAKLPVRPFGRAYVGIGGAPPTLFQVALSNRADVEAVITRWERSSRPRVPWLAPLPRQVALSALGAEAPAEGIRFALADQPTHQTQSPVAYRPREHGSLLIVGAAGSGKTGVLAAIASAPSHCEVIRVPSELPSLWDFITEVLGASPRDTEGRARVVLLDDLDSAIASCDEAYQGPLVELLSRLLRDGPALGLWCVLTAQRVGGALHGLTTLCGSQLVLRMPSRADHAVLGGAASEFVPDLAPGGGFWRGDRVQVAACRLPPLVPEAPRTVPVDLATARLTVVSTRPERFTELIREQAPARRVVALEPVGFGVRPDSLEVTVGDTPAILIADPDLWQSHWSLLATLQRTCDVLFDGCSLHELRALTRSRELPPPFPRGARPLWVRTADGKLDRASVAAD